MGVRHADSENDGQGASPGLRRAFWRRRQVLFVGIAVLWALASFQATQGAGPGVPTPLSEASLLLSQGTLRAIDVYDGRARASLHWQKEKDGWRSRDGALFLTIEARARKDRTDWLVSLRNEGRENAWLLVRAYATFQPTSSSWRYFNGNFAAQPRQSVVRDRLAYTMPMVAAYDEKAGLGLGLEPFQIFSYLENGVLPPPQGKTQPLTFYYGLKIVVDPQQTERVHFVTFSFSGGKGEEQAVAAYHALYPEAFRPLPDGDPRLQRTGNAGSAAIWYKPSPEALRRSRARCDWAYAPVKIPGDWYGRPQFWDRYNENVEDEKRLREFYGTLEHWHRFLRETFQRAAVDHGIAAYFYIINWAYYRLAEEAYPDAMIHDPRVQNRIGPWVTNKGPDHRLFLWGNKAAAQFHEDLRDIWAAYPLAGFGHDVAMGEAKYRGPAVAASPGRAWDEEGEYCDVSVCIAKTADFVHSLPKRRYRAGFWGNGADHIYSIAVRSDAGSFEGAPEDLPGDEAAMRYRRYMLGEKAIQLFAGDHRDRTTDYYNPDETSPAEIKEMYRRIRLAALQTAFKWGVLPCADLAWGWQEAEEWLEIADQELYPYPWQLRRLAWVKGAVEIAQYGVGKEARFVLINPRGAAAEGRLFVRSHNLYAAAEGGETTNIARGEQTIIPFRLPPAGISILVPIAFRPPTLQAGRWRVKRAADSEDGLRVEIAPTDKRLSLITPPGYEAAGDAPGHFSPQLFASPERAILDFFAGLLPPSRFLQGEERARLIQAREALAKKANWPGKIEILVPPGAAEEEQKAAEAIQEYFRYYTEEIMQQTRLVLPIVPEPTGSPLIRFGREERPTISVRGKTLLIAAPAGEALLEATRGLLRLLDRRYPFYGQIARWVHQRPKETELRQKLGLAGGTVLRDGTIVTTPLSAHLFHMLEKGPAYGKPWP